MKHLQDYQETKQTELFNKTGSFFAFGQSQFNEAKKEGVKYVDMGGGLICPKETAKELTEGLDRIYAESISEDLKENGKEKIIIRELYNHECFYTGSINSAVDALIGYDFTREEIKAAYNKEMPNVEF